MYKCHIGQLPDQVVILEVPKYILLMHTLNHRLIVNDDEDQELNQVLKILKVLQVVKDLQYFYLEKVQGVVNQVNYPENDVEVVEVLPYHDDVHYS
jgi:hypothetical protein